MIDTLLEIIAPHLCCGCQKIGKILCESCIENIVSRPYGCCIHCEKLAKDGICIRCRVTMPFERAWTVGPRTGVLRQLIDQYKFDRARAAHQVLAELLDRALPSFPKNTQVVSVPTVTGHIRQRGYDHCALIARSFARRRGLPFTPLLYRAESSQQRGASRVERDQQAAKAFYARDGVKLLPFLVIDDITTTGATLRSAARVLKAAGAESVAVATVAKQPLDDEPALW